MELRCPSKLHGIVERDTRSKLTIEVRCRSVFCGYRPGIVVLHQFDVHTGEITTRQFKDPGKKVKYGTDQHSAPLRAS